MIQAVPGAHLTIVGFKDESFLTKIGRVHFDFSQSFHYFASPFGMKMQTTTIPTIHHHSPCMDGRSLS
jgi:hypothetical protein